MKKTSTVIIILVAILMIWFLVDRGRKVEAPAVVDDVNKKSEDAKSVSPVSNSMPVPGAGSKVEEMVVVKEFTVLAKNFSFTPNIMTVKKGDRVKIIFKNTQGFHDFRIDEYGLATRGSSAPSEEMFEFKADKAGTFEYYCSVDGHRAMGMVGKLKVE